MHHMKRAAGLAVVLAAWTAAGSAVAAVVQVPQGGRPVPVTSKGTVCGPLQGGWTLEPDRRSVRPPSADLDAFARALEVKVAEDGATCANTKTTVTLIALGEWADLDTAGATFFPDDGRLELRGGKLKGLQVAWYAPSGDKDQPKQGSDFCLDPSINGKVQTCTIPLTAGLPADATLHWIPPYGRRGPDVTTYDLFAHLVDPESFRLRPARVVLSKPLVQSSGVDVSQGPGRVPLSHPEAVASVDCGFARCELTEAGVLVRGVPGPVSAVTMRLRLVPRAFVPKGDGLEGQVTVSLPLLSCPMTVVAGAAVRDVDEPAVVVKLDSSCGRDPRQLRWMVNGEQADVTKTVKAPDGVYALLHTSRIASDRVTVTAVRPELEGTIVASAAAPTAPLPQPRVALDLRGHGRVDFVPTNRAAQIAVSGAGAQGRLVPLPLEGAYDVFTREGTTYVRGEENAEGFVSLRFAYRVPSLPAELATEDLAVITERVQRAVREASVPAAFSRSAYEGNEPLVELVCAGSDGKDQRIVPGRPFRLPYDLRDSCRVIIHRERIKPEEGNQEVTLDVDVTKADGTARGEAHIEERMVLRPGSDLRIVPIKGGLGQFDKLSVRVSHVMNESRYVLSTTERNELPAVQWTGIVEGGHLRLYATAAIPAGLYRVNEPSGQLTLNFGVLSRLTLLNREGKEGLLGLELGVMGLGLIPRQSTVNFPPTLAIVSGLGLRIPLGQGAAVGVQAWVAYEFRDGQITYNPPPDPVPPQPGRWSFIFGPSISFGNVGINL